jgi:hypothetical protein
MPHIAELAQIGLGELRHIAETTSTTPSRAGPGNQLGSLPKIAYQVLIFGRREYGDLWRDLKEDDVPIYGSAMPSWASIRVREHSVLPLCDPNRSGSIPLPAPSSVSCSS